MLIRTQSDLQKHIAKLREDGETDKDLAKRLGLHVNTITKIKHSGAMFETIPSMKAFGLRVVYEKEK
jgi:ribosome-binding protein aMBF1 (putative translation factor)